MFTDNYSFPGSTCGRGHSNRQAPAGIPAGLEELVVETHKVSV